MLRQVRSRQAAKSSSHNLQNRLEFLRQEVPQVAWFLVAQVVELVATPFRPDMEYFSVRHQSYLACSQAPTARSAIEAIM